MIVRFLFFISSLLCFNLLLAEHPTHLDHLLRQAQQAQQHDQSVRELREQTFLAKRAEQKQLLEQLREQVEIERLRGATLKTTFETNESSLVELETELSQQTGDLGELFGAVKQVAKDLTTTLQDSLVSGQYPDRAAWFKLLGESKKLPDITELERLWLLMQQEIVESGRVVRFPAQVVGVDGVTNEREIVRIGLFNAIESDRYLKFQPESGRFVELSRQPADSDRALAASFMATPDGYAPLAIDPTRGVLLGMLVETPDLIERLHQGGIVGYVILALGALGLLIVIVRLGYLSLVGHKIRRQLRTLTQPAADNPLGRVLMLARVDQEGDPKNLELQIDEAVLREVPRLVRGEGLVKLLAGVAPLLGLLGTVVGMIVTFQSISLFGTGDPKLMANGISQALVTTALGLIVAIPLLFMHSLVATRSRLLVQILDEQSAGLVAMRAEQER
ncbi:MAG: MotA/TolQ/ExbB proton channel family protein [Sedimenticola sp.]|nr:MotA/TolQ/ExbB proton channel family protein [Sedimenticola sp.]